MVHEKTRQGRPGITYPVNAIRLFHHFKRLTPDELDMQAQLDEARYAEFIPDVPLPPTNGYIDATDSANIADTSSLNSTNEQQGRNTHQVVTPMLYFFL